MPSSRSRSQYTLLRDAIRRRQKICAQKLLSEGAPVNPSNKSKANTPLHWALKNGYDFNFIETLIRKGANLYASNSKRETPLLLAVSHNREDVVKLILRQITHSVENIQELIVEATTKMNINVVILLYRVAVQNNSHINLRCAVKIAARKGCIDILRFFLSNYKSHKGGVRYIWKTLTLENAATAQEVCNLFSQHGFLINSDAKQRFDAVYTAIGNNNYNLVNGSLQRGVEINVINEDTGLALLHVACIKENEQMVQLLLQHNADVNIKVSEIESADDSSYTHINFNSQFKFLNKTPLFIAVYMSNATILNSLLASGVNINEEPNILLTAVEKSSDEIIKALIDAGANVNATDSHGGTPLYYRFRDRPHVFYHFDCPSSKIKIFESETEIVPLFLNKGANPNVKAGLFSPLQACIVKGYSVLVELLLKYNADINHLDSNGNTPLHNAANSNPHIFDLIVKRNPNINVSNRQSETPFIVAAKNSNYYALKKLLEHNANIHDVDEKENTALHLVCQNCKSLDIVTLLLKYNANVNARNYREQTPLHIIALNGRKLESNIYKEIINTLVEYKAEINSFDREQETPIHIACRNTDGTLVKVLLEHGADINKKDILGKALLHNAANNTDVSSFIFLLKHGADINILSNNNKSVLDYIQDGIESIDETDDDDGDYDDDYDDDYDNGCSESDSSDYNRRRYNYRDRRYSDEYDSDEYNSDRSIEHMVSWGELRRYTNPLAKKRIEIYKIAREHIIKLHCAKMEVNEKNFALIYYDYDFPEKVDTFINKYRFDEIDNIADIEERCANEMKYLKYEKIAGITVYDILVKNTHDLINFAKNEEVIEALHSENLDQFLLYSDIIKNKFIAVLRRSKLLEVAVNYVSSICCSLPLICIDRILSFLDAENLELFTTISKQAGKTIKK